MKKLLAATLLACMVCMASFAQQVVVLPSDSWMEENGFMETKDDAGITHKIPKYADVKNGNREMSAALSYIMQGITNYGFSSTTLIELVDSEMSADEAFLAVQKALDGCIFHIYVDLQVKPVGPAKDIRLKMHIVDHANFDDVGTVEEHMAQTTQPVDAALRLAVGEKKPELVDSMLAYIKDLRENGQKVRVVFHADRESGIDFFENNFAGSGLSASDYLLRMVQEYAVQRAAKKGRLTKSMCEIRNVRIPMFTQQSEQLNPREWAKSFLMVFKRDTGKELTIREPGMFSKFSVVDIDIK